MSVSSSYHSASSSYTSDSLSSGNESRYSPGDDDSTPHRPTHSQYASYAALVRNLQERERKPLARRLTRLVNRSTGSSNGLNDQSAGSEQVAGYEGSLAFSTRWPLAAIDLPGLGSTLDEAVNTFAGSYIRKAGLSLSHVHNASGTDDSTRSLNLESTRLEGNGDELQPIHNGEYAQALYGEDHPYLPHKLAASTRRCINTTLVALAGLRPVVNTKYAFEMRGMAWDRVIAAASLEYDNEEIVSAANKRCREIFQQDEEEDLISHRMSIISKSKTSRSAQISDKRGLYQPIIIEEKKPHQSKEELGRREQKRLVKEEKRRLKEAEKLERSRSRKKRRVGKDNDITT